MKIQCICIVVMTGLAGCARSSPWQAPPGHAASAESSTAPYSEPRNVLAHETQDKPTSQPSTMPHDDHDHATHGSHAATQPASQSDYPLDICVVSGAALGSMGDPIIYDHEGTEVRFCCGGCVGMFEADPEPYLRTLREAQKVDHSMHGGGS